jgi:hypothetical protein
MRSPLAFACAVFLASRAAAQQAPVDQLIPWLLRADGELRTIPFSQVIFDTTGKRVLAIDPKSEADQRIIRQPSAVIDEVMTRMNAPDSPVQTVGRINEASSHFEDLLREKLNGVPGFSCDFPRTSEDRVQRSGYPDLRLVHDDAVHLLVGFEHEIRNGGRWNFIRWDLVDLAHFHVRLKAEFQGSNRDIYRPDAIVATSAK